MGRRIYAGVGSRSAPPDILARLSLIAQRLALKDWGVRTGRAPGADQAIERGCDLSEGYKEIFIPWKGFPGHGHYDYPVPFLEPNVLNSEPNQKAFEIAFKIMGAAHWGRLTQGMQKLHARNVFQVLGPNCDSPGDMLICWAEPFGMGVKGGTNTAWRLAKAHNVQCYNIYHPKDMQIVLGMLW